MSKISHRSPSEQLMVDVLKRSAEPLTLKEIVGKIIKREPGLLKGKTPSNSLYSIIYRRENRRKEYGLPRLFIKTTRGGAIHYRLNPKAK